MTTAEVEAVLARAFPEPINEEFYLLAHGWWESGIEPEESVGWFNDDIDRGCTFADALTTSRQLDEWFAGSPELPTLLTGRILLAGISRSYHYLCAHPERAVGFSCDDYLAKKVWCDANVPPLFPAQADSDAADAAQGTGE